MKRTLATALLAAVALLTGGCGDGDSPTSGDSNPDNQQTQEPGQAPTIDPTAVPTS
jgi:hypothetical protein